MKRRGGVWFALFFLFLNLFPKAIHAEPYKASPILKFQTKQEENDYYFRRGRVLIEGGYEGPAVWGKMVGLVAATPEQVWKLFISANDWRRYRLPNVREARVLTPELAKQVEGIEHVEDFYRIMNNRVIPNEYGRMHGGTWVEYNFQYFNIPWPIADRWYVVKQENDERKSTQEIYRAEWTKIVGNVKTIDGYILLEPFEGHPNITRMEYKAITNPYVHVPRFLLKWGINRVMPGVIEAIRRQLNNASIVLDAS